MYINPTDLEKSIAWLDIERVLADITSEAESYSALEKRQFGYGGYGYYNRNSAWGSYGRWILLGVLVGLAVLFWLIICGCNRRRTRTGNAPVKYTGWATPGFSHPQQTGVASTQPYGAPNPQYPMQQYPNAGYQQPQPEYQQGYQPNQGYGQTTNNTGYNEYSGNAPPTYPAQTPAYPANVASTREK